MDGWIGTEKQRESMGIWCDGYMYLYLYLLPLRHINNSSAFFYYWDEIKTEKKKEQNREQISGYG